jgi:DNA-binding MarR family transcriptional regulator
VRVAEFRLALRGFLASSDRIARRAGLTPQRYLLLLTLEAHGHGHVTVGDLATRLALAISTVTGLLERAEHVGLVERRPAGHDGRVVHVRATSKGKRLFAQAFAAHERARDELADGIAPLTRR